jgi:hypothetical protein
VGQDPLSKAKQRNFEAHRRRWDLVQRFLKIPKKQDL